MIRFILSFVFFGLLFYAIWIFFPDAFKTMVSWAASLFDYLNHLFAKPLAPETPKHETAMAIFGYFM